MFNKNTPTQLFSYDYYEIIKNNYFEEQLQTDVSVPAYFEFHMGETSRNV